jgi:transcription elongation factor S-II
MVHVDFREKIIHKYDTIIKNREISERLENAIYNWCLKEIEKRGMTISDLFYKMYMNKNIHIFTNIDPDCCIKNEFLLKNILDKSIPLEDIPEMTPQKIFPEHWKILQDKQKARDEFLYLKKPEAATDEFKCSKCKQRKCTYYELQTRSIDEPMTKFIRCLVCENRWRMSA